MVKEGLSEQVTFEPSQRGRGGRSSRPREQPAQGPGVGNVTATFKEKREAGVVRMQ